MIYQPTTPVVAFTRVKLPYGWLGNMAPYPLTYQRKIWRTPEALFQALRFADGDPIRTEIQTAKSPMAAKLIAKREIACAVVTPRSVADVAHMDQVLRWKLDQHPELVARLLATRDRLIVEDVSARPCPAALFWGAKLTAAGWEGENTLGRLWMALRDERS